MSLDNSEAFPCQLHEDKMGISWCEKSNMNQTILNRFKFYLTINYFK